MAGNSNDKTIPLFTNTQLFSIEIGKSVYSDLYVLKIVHQPGSTKLNKMSSYDDIEITIVDPNLLGKAQAKSRTVWTDHETRALLEIWPNYMRDLKKITAKKPIFAKMQVELANKYNVFRNSEQIQKKMAKLRQDFHKANKTPTGSKEWPYFNEMHNILAGDHFYNPETTLPIETNTEQRLNDNDNSNDSEVILTNTSEGKRKRSPSPSSELSKRRLISLTESLVERQIQMMDDLKEMKDTFMKIAEKYLKE